MSILKLINEVQKNGIRLYLDNGMLRCLAPNGVIPTEIYNEIKNRKSEIIDFLNEATNEKSAITTRPVSSDDKIPLSFAQQRLWFIDQLLPNNSLYNIHMPVRLSGPLNIAALHRTFTTVVARHEALRTVFVNDEGTPRQVIDPPSGLALPIIDLSDLNERDAEAHMYQLVKAESCTIFDLSKGPLFRTTLLRLSPTHHIVILSMHHIISDGWSMGVLTRELSILYTSFTHNAPNPLPPLAIQYADFAYWQRNWLKGEVLEQQLSYWKNQLESAPQLLELPTDRPRPSVQGYRGASLPINLPSALSQKLSKLSLQQGATLFMTLMTALHVLLSKLSNQSDICVGTPIANRRHSELEPLIGFFANTLVIRTSMDDNPSFTELLSKTRHTILDSYSHQDLPFEQLIDSLNVEREMSYSPLFQVLFGLQNAPKPSLKEGELQLQNVDTPNPIVRFDLELFLVESPQGIKGSWQYDKDLFDAKTIEHWTNMFGQLLEQVVANPHARLSDLLLLDKEQWQQKMLDWNDTSVTYPVTPYLHTLLDAHAAHTPDALAVVFEDQSLTYAQLNRRANQLAYYLRAQGVGPDVLVGVCMERSFDMVVALLGILKAGGAYVPLDPEYPTARLQFILQDTQAPLLLTQQHLLTTLPALAVDPVCVDTLWPQIRDASVVVLPTPAPDNLAYVLYTSGSTGQPKGVAISHAGLRNRLLWMQDHFRLRPHDRVLQKTPFSFDVSGWEFFWPLITGACLVVARPDGHKDSAYLSHIIDQQRITTIHFVPSMLQVFLEQLPADSATSLQRIICSGEALTPALQQRCQTLLSADLHNLYGPTEASIDVTAWNCSAQADPLRVPIGKPIANTQTYILDSYLNPLPVGVPGELYLGGIGLARAYINRPGLTAQAFIPHPFGNQGERLYKTGDRARYLEDGNIEYLGRIDHQVKLRGLRIELGEIEAALCLHPAISEAAVLLREDRPGLTQLAAYIVWQNQDETLDNQALKTFLQKQLPDYMLPTTYTSLAQMPLTTSGKLNRKALPVPGVITSAHEYVAPR
ncbi:MAG: amino acid adenylation domain-containing protein, partial [Gammaproteobacteria bacterium]|nr:amino acid adenylation domain-containing protein [Gammaproteobacteria bacterium]